MLQYDGVSPADVEKVNVSFNLTPALIGGKVDAIVGGYFTHESIVAENQGYPVNVMHLQDWGVPDYYELVLTTSQKNVNERPDLVRKLVHAVTRGYEDAVREPETAIGLLLDAYPEADEAVERLGIEILVPMWKDKNPIVGWQEESRWVDFAAWMKENGVLEDEVDARKAFTNEFVATVLSLSVR